MNESTTKREFRFVRAPRRSRGIYVSANGLACTYLVQQQGDGRVKNVEINGKAPRAQPGNYWSVTQANLGWHADHLARKVDHRSDDSDGSPVNRSDLQSDLLQMVPIPT